MLKCDLCQEPAEIFLIKRLYEGPLGGVIKSVRFQMGKVIEVEDLKDVIPFTQRRCLLHGIPKLYWRRHLQNSLDFLKGI